MGGNLRRSRGDATTGTSFSKTNSNAMESATSAKGSANLIRSGL